ncbi:MAG: lipopolysaccharide biosynthesis protein [Gemmatimonadales bacterium]|nr:lipopolysaccharide biosynthesis protein [Gemmatimonadales bacterium]
MTESGGNPLDDGHHQFDARRLAGRRTIAWSLIQQIGSQAVNYIVFLILAVVLPPSDFGVVAMASVWLAILGAFAESGFGAALVQRAELRPSHVSTTFVINLAAGVMLAALGAALAFPAAALYRMPAVAPVMTVLAAAFVIRSLSLTQAALAQRAVNFRALAMRDVGSNVAGGVVGVGMALAGYGVWSLVGMTLVGASVGTVLLWQVTSWRPRWHEVSRAAAAELWPYSSRVLGFNFFKAISQNTDRLVIGFTLGAHAVGLYAFASRLIILPVTVIVGAFGNYLFPEVARWQHDPRAVRALIRRTSRPMLAIVLPGLAGMVMMAPAVVTLFGTQWREAAVLVQVLSVAALMQVMYSPTGQLMKGLNRPGLLLAWAIGFTPVVAAALWVGSRWGVAGTAIAFSVIHVVCLPVILYIARRLADVRLADLVGVGWPAGLATLALVACLEVGVAQAPVYGRSSLVAAAFLGSALYCVVLARLSPSLTAAMNGWLRRRTGVRRA